MSDDLTTGTTPEATGTPASQDDGSATNGAGGSGESIEELRAKLQEAERQKAQLLSEKSRVEQQQREIERERERLAGYTPPTSAQREAPIVTRIRELREHLATYPDDVVARATHDSLMAQYELHQQTVMRDRIEEDLDSVDDPALRKEIRTAMKTGEFASVAAARKAVLGERYEREQDAMKRERDRLSAQSKVADVQTATRGVSAQEHRERTIPFSKYKETMEAGGEAARKLMLDIDSGAVRIER